jgi:hypothetical protein
MAIMNPTLRKIALTVHVATSVGLLGAVLSFLVLVAAGMAGAGDQVVGGFYIMANLIAERVILPLMMASLIVGVAEGLWTPWRLFKHRWVTAKFVITALATLVLLAQMHPIGQLAGAALNGTPMDAGLQHRVLIHAAGGLLVLLVPLALSIYKPSAAARRT